MTLLDPTYAKKYFPIIASVSEHQPTGWSNYFFDLGYLIFFLPIGYYYLLIEDITHGKIFIAIYGVLATYFSCVMIRLMLTLAPAVCIIAGIAISEIFRKTGDSIREFVKLWHIPVRPETLEVQDKPESSGKKGGKGKGSKRTG